jgi:hypothetical protein
MSGEFMADETNQESFHVIRWKAWPESFV